MRIGIISEGQTDIAVITNIIIGVTGLDKSNIIPLRPLLSYDATDIANADPNSFSTWSLVKKECIDREKIDQFFAIDGQEYIVLHLDTAECEKYDVPRPIKDDSYCVNLRNAVLNKINEWLDNNTTNILHAIAIEETEAWILATIEKKDSTKSVSPKEKMDYILGKKNIDTSKTYDNYLRLSKPLSKSKDIKKSKYLDNNCSLKLFYEEVVNTFEKEEK